MVGARQNSRIRIYRDYLRLRDAVKKMQELGLISESNRIELETRVDQVNSAWREQIRRERLEKGIKPGRPKLADRSAITVCKKPGCGMPPAPDQAYCTPEHAPYQLGAFDDDEASA
jgi:hypothetical protein